jgi:hypothetical protein
VDYNSLVTVSFVEKNNNSVLQVRYVPDSRSTILLRASTFVIMSPCNSLATITCISARSLTSPVKTLSSSWPSGNIVEILYQLSRSCSGVNASADSFVRSALTSLPNFDVSFNRRRATGSKHAYRHKAMLLVELRDLRLLDPW